MEIEESLNFSLQGAPRGAEKSEREVGELRIEDHVDYGVGNDGDYVHDSDVDGGYGSVGVQASDARANDSATDDRHVVGYATLDIAGSRQQPAPSRNSALWWL